MSRKVLVLGGTDFVGPAAVEAALARGDAVTVFHRGQTGSAPDGVEVIHGDRTNAADLDKLATQDWDLVVDAWSQAPRVVLEVGAEARAARGALRIHLHGLGVRQDAIRATEASPTVEAVADAGATDYAADKRGAELAIESVFGAERCVFARPGLILGPRENINRLPWWLRRIARGGNVLAPEPKELPLQFIDARDLTAFAINTQLNGPVNVLSRPDHSTMAEIIALCAEVTGSNATFTWVDAEFLLAHDVAPWTELPIWVPPIGEYKDFYTADSSLALAAGLNCRSARETVQDTWAWLAANPQWQQVVRANREPTGLDAAKEAALLAAWADQSPDSR